jgi:trehalose synthase
VLPNGDDTALVNTLQRRAAVVLQKSLREGFGLTVAEAIWKGTPVIGGNVGGIRSQIEDGVNGFLVS